MFCCGYIISSCGLIWFIRRDFLGLRWHMQSYGYPSANKRYGQDRSELNHNRTQQNANRLYNAWDILYVPIIYWDQHNVQIFQHPNNEIYLNVVQLPDATQRFHNSITWIFHVCNLAKRWVTFNSWVTMFFTAEHTYLIQGVYTYLLSKVY